MRCSICDCMGNKEKPVSDYIHLSGRKDILCQNCINIIYPPSQEEEGQEEEVDTDILYNLDLLEQYPFLEEDYVEPPSSTTCIQGSTGRPPTAPGMFQATLPPEASHLPARREIYPPGVDIFMGVPVVGGKASKLRHKNDG